MKLTCKDYAEKEHQIEGILCKATISLLVYVLVGTLMDLVFAMSVKSQHIEKQDPMHLTTIKMIIRYLKDSFNFKLYLKRKNNYII